MAADPEFNGGVSHTDSGWHAWQVHDGHLLESWGDTYEEAVADLTQLMVDYEERTNA